MSSWDFCLHECHNLLLCHSKCLQFFLVSFRFLRRSRSWNKFVLVSHIIWNPYWIFFSNFSSDEESSQVFIPFVSDVKVGTEAMPGPSSLELEDTIGKFYKLTIILSNLNIFSYAWKNVEIGKSVQIIYQHQFFIH